MVLHSRTDSKSNVDRLNGRTRHISRHISHRFTIGRTKWLRLLERFDLRVGRVPRVLLKRRSRVRLLFARLSQVLTLPRDCSTKCAIALNKLRNAARVLLTLNEEDPKRIFEGNAILKRMRTYGLLEADKESLDYVLELRAEDFLERRLQTLVFKLGLAKSVHHARILIKQRHIRVGKQIVNVPSFLVRVETQKHIDFALNSPLGGGRPGRVKRRRIAQKAAAAGGGNDEEEEEE